MSNEPSAAEEIMDGVYQALCIHGYAGLTMQDIADECSKSKSLLHYHYDTKEDLLVAFLDHLVTEYEDHGAGRREGSPVERLVEFIGWYVFTSDDTNRESFHIALLELRSQGPFNERIREQLQRSDGLLRETVEMILRDGIEAGAFDPVDVEETAALLVATLDGARTRQITLDGGRVDDDTYTRTVASATLRRIVEPFLAEGVDLPDLRAVIESKPVGSEEASEADGETTE